MASHTVCKRTDPIPGPTAMMLLALQDAGPPRIAHRRYFRSCQTKRDVERNAGHPGARAIDRGASQILANLETASLTP